jgi:hypothetical protein
MVVAPPSGFKKTLFFQIFCLNFRRKSEKKIHRYIHPYDNAGPYIIMVVQLVYNLALSNRTDPAGRLN